MFRPVSILTVLSCAWLLSACSGRAPDPMSGSPPAAAPVAAGDARASDAWPECDRVRVPRGSWTLTIHGKEDLELEIRDLPPGCNLLSLQGDGGTNLDLYVRQEDGSFTCLDDRPGDECLGLLECDQPQTFIVRLRNLGARKNHVSGTLACERG